MNLNAIKSLDFNDPPLKRLSMSERQWAERSNLPASEFELFEDGIYDPHITEADCRKKPSKTPQDTGDRWFGVDFVDGDSKTGILFCSSHEVEWILTVSP
jgi:hypothetical protein